MVKIDGKKPRGNHGKGGEAIDKSRILLPASLEQDVESTFMTDENSEEREGTLRFGESAVDNNIDEEEQKSDSLMSLLLSVKSDIASIKSDVADRFKVMDNSMMHFKEAVGALKKRFTKIERKSEEEDDDEEYHQDDEDHLLSASHFLQSDEEQVDYDEEEDPVNDGNDGSDLLPPVDAAAGSSYSSSSVVLPTKPSSNVRLPPIKRSSTTTVRVMNLNQPPRQLSRGDLTSGATVRCSGLLREAIEYLVVSLAGELQGGTGEEYSVIFDTTARSLLSRWHGNNKWRNLEPRELHDFIRDHWQEYYTLHGRSADNTPGSTSVESSLLSVRLEWDGVSMATIDQFLATIEEKIADHKSYLTGDSSEFVERNSSLIRKMIKDCVSPRNQHLMTPQMKMADALKLQNFGPDWNLFLLALETYAKEKVKVARLAANHGFVIDGGLRSKLSFATSGVVGGNQNSRRQHDDNKQQQPTSLQKKRQGDNPRERDAVSRPLCTGCGKAHVHEGNNPLCNLSKHEDFNGNPSLAWADSPTGKLWSNRGRFSLPWDEKLSGGRPASFVVRHSGNPQSMMNTK